MNAVPKAVRAAVQPALDKSAGELVDRARSLAPVDDGTLKDSIAADRGEHELQRVVTAGEGDAFYARFVEHGTPLWSAHSCNVRTSPFARMTRR